MQVMLGNLPLPASGLKWAFAPGVAPFVSRVRVPESTHRALLTLPSPTTLRVVLPGCGDGNENAAAGRFEVAGVFLLAWSRATAFEFEWEIGDVRSQWRGDDVAGEFNIATAYNDADVFDATATHAAAAGSGLLSGAEPILPAARYRPHSLNPTTGAPWTALELAAELLSRIAGNSFAGPVRGLRDNGVIPENIRVGESIGASSGDDVGRVIGELLADAEVDVFAFADGFARLVPVGEDPAAFLPALPMAEGSAGLTRVDAASLRPRAVAVMFERAVEREFVFTAPGDTVANVATAANADAGPVAGRLVNVIRLPRDERLTAWGLPAREWPAGAFVPIGDALAAWGIGDELVREGWFFSGIERALAGGEAVADAESIARAAAIREHFRQSFAIHPDDLRGIAAWENRRISRPNPHTGAPGISVAKAAVTVVPLLRPAVAAFANGDELAAAGAVISGTGAAGVPAGEVAILDAAAGIFRVSFAAALTAGIFTVVPGTVDALPSAALNAEGAGWHSAMIADDWTLRVALSIVPADAAQRFASVSFDATALGAGEFRAAAHPPVKRLCGRDFVRVAETAGAGESFAGEIFGIEGALNAEILRRVARAEGRRVMRRWMPAWRGAVIFEGLPAIEIFGGVAELAVEISPCGRVTTTVRMRG